MSIQNVARGRCAWQSSLSQWSKGVTIEEDATRATNGDPTKDYAFHTDFEPSPWWIVDLEDNYDIKKIHVYNRNGYTGLRIRASPILIETSLDRDIWTEFFRAEPGFVFGGDEEEGRPLVCPAPGWTQARYVRISVPSDGTYLHLAEVEVYGTPVELQSAQPAASVPTDVVADELPTDDAPVGPPRDAPEAENVSQPVAAGREEAPPPPAAGRPSSPPKSGGWLSFLGW